MIAGAARGAHPAPGGAAGPGSTAFTARETGLTCGPDAIRAVRADPAGAAVAAPATSAVGASDPGAATLTAGTPGATVEPGGSGLRAVFRSRAVAADASGSADTVMAHRARGARAFARSTTRTGPPAAASGAAGLAIGTRNRDAVGAAAARSAVSADTAGAVDTPGRR